MRKGVTVCTVSLILVTLLAIGILLPVYWMVKGGFESIVGAMKVPPTFLPRVTLENYKVIFGAPSAVGRFRSLTPTKYPVFRWYLNSFIVAGAATLLVVLCSCMAGYTFAKKEFPAKNIFFWLMLITMMIPFQVTLIPRYMMMRSLGMVNTYPGIFLPMACGAGGMFLARQYMSTIQSDLIDSARIDGAGELRIFFLIILPIAKPLVACLTIFTFCGAWNDFLWPLIMTTAELMRTLPIAIAGISAMPGELIDIGIAMAGATLVALPMYIIFFLFQKYFVKGITLGGVKG